MKKYCVITFGCQANLADSEKISGILEKRGYKKTENPQKCSLLVFNTCSVRQTAEDRIFGLNKNLKKMKAANPKLKVILTGCMMHYSEKELRKRLPYIDYFIDIKKMVNGSGLSRLAEGLVPVSYGCNNFCSYCIVPFSRGKEVCRPAKEIIGDIKASLKNGVKEIWLLGQIVNNYKYGKINFSGLLRRVNSLPGDFWLRFTSPNPENFSDELIKTMAECKKFQHYVNLPVQSGSNAILKKMNRHYTISEYKKLVAKIRKAMPDIALSTDVIVGFPGETKKQFQETAKLFKKMNLDMAFVSEYSPRPKTLAARILKDNVSKKEKARRKKELNEILEKTALANNKKLVGKTLKIFNNRTAGNKFVKIKEKHPKDKFITAEIVKAGPWKLTGKMVK